LEVIFIIVEAGKEIFIIQCVKNKMYEKISILYLTVGNSCEPLTYYKELFAQFAGTVLSFAHSRIASIFSDITVERGRVFLISSRSISVFNCIYPPTTE